MSVLLTETKTQLSPSALLHYSAEPRLLRCVAENGVVLHIYLLGEGLLRFRYSTDGLFVEDFSYAISESFQVSGEWQVAEYKEYISLTTSCAECRIAREDLRITLLDRAGNVLLADEKGFHWEEPGAGAAPIVMMSKEARKGERYFGLGDKSCDFDLRGKRLQNWVHDSFGFGPDSDPLYKAIPFYMGMYEGRSYGIFFDNSFKTWFDFAAEREEATSFWAHGGEMNYYFFCETHPLEIASTYACLTGLPELPPLWSLGYHQSRWSYYPESEVLGLAKKFREEQIPCDSIYLDIDYMDGYRVFTWNFEHFPEPARMMAELEAQGFRTVAMLDPGIKIDPEYALFREGLEKNVFLRRSDGEYAKGKVWPGNCLFPDFTRPDVRSWWAGLYRDFLRKYGVHGIWNDMNEPACFEVESKTLPDDVRFDCDGHPASHLKAHNIYGMQMARASLEGIRENVYPRRPFLLTRATYSGGQRYAATWTGDNVATWEHLQIANRQVQRLSISGFSLSGSDIGGFNERPDGELFVRWLETGIFHPFFRVHSMGYNLAGDAAVDEEAVLEHMRMGRPIDQEPWSFGELFTPLARKIINLRYQLLPAIYTAVYQYVTYGVPVLRPLAFEAPGDALAAENWSQFLMGDHLLAAPVTAQGVLVQKVYLPQGEWYSLSDGTRYTGGRSYLIRASLGQVPLFLRSGGVLPMGPVRQYSSEPNAEPLTLVVAPGTGSSLLYEDKGEGYDYREGKYRRSVFTVSQAKGRLHISREREGRFQPEYAKIRIQVLGSGKEVIVDQDFTEVLI